MKTSSDKSVSSAKEYVPQFSGELHCRHLPVISPNAGWICDPDANACQLVCVEHTEDGLVLNHFVDVNGNALPMIDCNCANLDDGTTCQYFINQNFETKFTDNDLTGFYGNSCALSTTPAPTTPTPYWNKCGELPVLEIGYWSCHGNVCVLRCPASEISSIELSIQCMCMTSDQSHCTFIKTQPTWISDHARFDFTVGFEARDGFKCRPKASTTTVPSTTSETMVTCVDLPKPNLPYGEWICSDAAKYCSFACPSDFTKSKVNLKVICPLNPNCATKRSSPSNANARQQSVGGLSATRFHLTLPTSALAGTHSKVYRV